MMLLTGLLVFFAQADIVRYLPRYSVKLKGGVDQARALSKARRATSRHSTTQNGKISGISTARREESN
ncbi:unnamed protein product [Oikopleura dioica]|uniref:Uncharacterized protein n=1 Tax=Oikopleura dioica TaxID=34765 RepID=E4XCS7_OIKDI|nr:unnamed protein product [Oikopleura dioica]